MWGQAVSAMGLTVDHEQLEAVLTETRSLQGISLVRAWVGEGDLSVGDDIMFVLVGGDIRENVFAALQTCVGAIKASVVTEVEVPA